MTTKYVDFLSKNADKIAEQNSVAVEVIHNTVQAVDNFLKDQSLVTANVLDNLSCETLEIVSITNLAKSKSIDLSPVEAMVEKAGISENLRGVAIEDISRCLADIREQQHSYASHIAQSRAPSASAGTEVVSSSYIQLFGGAAAGNIAAESKYVMTTPAVESFGIDMDTNAYDARTAIAVRLLRFHKSTIDRVIPRRPTDNDTIMFTQVNAEHYDLEKSQNRSAAVRYGNHARPLLELYRNPNIANTTAREVDLKLANATKGELFSDNVIKIGASFNLFDMAVDTNSIATQNTDWGDLISDGILLKDLYVEVTDGTDYETIVVPANNPFNVFVPPANNFMVSDRVCNYNSSYSITAGQKLKDGAVSALLAGVTAPHTIATTIAANVSVNLQSGEVSDSGANVRIQLVTTDDSAVVAGVQTAVNKLTFKVVGYSFTAYYSEENLRKAKSAVRIVSRQHTAVIPLSRTLLTEYSMLQTSSADVLSIVNEVNTIGNDSKGLGYVENAITYGRNRIAAEGQFKPADYKQSFGYSTVSGALVNPYIIDKAIDVGDLVDNLKSSELMYDIAGMVQYYLLKEFADIEWNSMLTRALPDGQKIRWKCITSEPIRKLLLNMPTRDGNAVGEPQDGAEGYLRLPDGTEIDIVTNTYSEYENKMTFVPTVEGDRESVLNFGNNWDRGVWVAHYPYTGNNASTKRIATNAREMVYPTNYVAMRLAVKNLDKLQDMAGQLKVVQVTP